MSERLLIGWIKPLLATYPTALACVRCYAECGPGWSSLVEPLIAQCEQESLAVVQIKQKFGALRFYTEAKGSVELEEMIKRAEAASVYMCEKCGKYAAQNNYNTLCEEHQRPR